MSGSSEPGVRRLVVDRVEATLVVVEVDGSDVVDVPEWLLPPGLQEGDVLWTRGEWVDGRWRVELWVDEAETLAVREEAERRLDRLRARDPGGDIRL